MKLSFYCSYSKNTSMMRWRKYGEMAFLMSRNGNKMLALAYSQACCESEIHWGSVHVTPLHRSSIARPHKMSSECCRACN